MPDDPDPASFAPPEDKTGADALHQIARAGLSAFPVIGGPAEELLDALVTPPLQKRLAEWRRSVGVALSYLQQNRGVPIEALRNHPNFVDVVVQATQAAIATSEEEKLKALRAAILHSALPDPPEGAMQQMFVRWISELSHWHFRTLRILRDPLEWFGGKEPTLGPPGGHFEVFKLVAAAYPELAVNDRPFFQQVVRDLDQRGLLSVRDPESARAIHHIVKPWLSTLGLRFLGYIEPP